MAADPLLFLVCQQRRGKNIESKKSPSPIPLVKWRKGIGRKKKKRKRPYDHHYLLLYTISGEWRNPEKKGELFLLSSTTWQGKKKKRGKRGRGEFAVHFASSVYVFAAGEKKKKGFEKKKKNAQTVWHKTQHDMPPNGRGLGRKEKGERRRSHPCNFLLFHPLNSSTRKRRKEEKE